MKQTFVKAAVLACCMAAVGCKQAPMTMGPGEYAVMTIATTDRESIFSHNFQFFQFSNGITSVGYQFSYKNIMV